MVNDMRLIDADAIPWCNYDLDNYLYFVGVDKEYVDALPTIDAVPVVRCKDCRWSRTNQKDGADVYYCELRTGRAYHSGDFCSYGEKGG